MVLTAWCLNIQPVQITVSPLAHCVQNRDKALAKSSEGIQSLWWLFRYNFTMNDTTVFQIMELLREHFRGCFWYESLQFSIVQGMVYQKPENHRLIFAAD